jgi:hypothetical protein
MSSNCHKIKGRSKARLDRYGKLYPPKWTPNWHLWESGCSASQAYCTKVSQWWLEYSSTRQTLVSKKTGKIGKIFMKILFVIISANKGHSVLSHFHWKVDCWVTNSLVLPWNMNRRPPLDWELLVTMAIWSVWCCKHNQYFMFLMLNNA